MKRANIEEAKQEALRFLKRIEEFEAVDTHRDSTYIAYNPKESGALRRSSLDLTRALAKMRKYE